jgi:hypothetical protein
MNDSEESTWIEQHFDLVKEVYKGTKYKKFVDDALITYEWNRHNRGSSSKSAENGGLHYFKVRFFINPLTSVSANCKIL